MTKDLEVWLEIFPGDQVFTHSDDAGVKRTFYTSAMGRIAAKYGGRCDQIIGVRLPIDAETVQRINLQMGVERARVDRLVEPYLSMPVIGIQWPERMHKGKKVCTIVDGNHRIVKLSELGVAHYNCFVFTHPFWEDFLAPTVQEIPIYSGIIESEKLYGCSSTSSSLSVGSSRPSGASRE